MTATDVDFLIIGAGVVGLAVAVALTRAYPDALTVVIERHARPGQEASSRNSEVVHAGIYYRDAPLKARHCVAGNRLLQEFCRDHQVPLRSCGKYVVATAREHLPILAGIHETARRNGARLDEADLAAVRAELDHPGIIAALHSPATGIIDSHALVQRLAALARAQGALLLCGHDCLSIEHSDAQGTVIQVREPGQQRSLVRARRLINCAGLGADRIARAFPGLGGVSLRPCRGRYFSLSSRYTGRYRTLVYPVPDPAGGLGTHITFDLSGRCRLGPDVDWSQAAASAADDPALCQITNSDAAQRDAFLAAGRRLIPTLAEDDLAIEAVGVRAKLFIDGVAWPDFLIARGPPQASDLHLLGIESPGLTAALSLASEVARRMGD